MAESGYLLICLTFQEVTRLYSPVDSADLLIVTQIVAYWHALCA